MNETKEKAIKEGEGKKRVRPIRAEAGKKKIYVGPTILGVAIKNTVYENEIPVSLQNAIKENPCFSNLVIGIEQYPVAECMIRNKRGYVYDAYVKVVEGGKRQ